MEPLGELTISTHGQGRGDERIGEGGLKRSLWAESYALTFRTLGWPEWEPACL